MGRQLPRTPAASKSSNSTIITAQRLELPSHKVSAVIVVELYKRGFEGVERGM